MYEMSNKNRGVAMASEYEIAVTQLFKTETQQRVIDYALSEMDADRWYQTGQIAEEVGKSRNAVADVIQPREGVIGPLIQFGIIEAKHNPMNMPNIPQYTVADTLVVDLLRAWHDGSHSEPSTSDSGTQNHKNGYDLSDLFEYSGAQELVAFFVLEGDDEAWSSNQIRHEMGASFEMVKRHIGKLVDAGLVIEEETPRTTAYRLDTGSDIYQFLGRLNNAVLDVAESF